jgi:hypothetical protein
LCLFLGAATGMAVVCLFLVAMETSDPIPTRKRNASFSFQVLSFPFSLLFHLSFLGAGGRLTASGGVSRPRRTLGLEHNKTAISSFAVSSPCIETLWILSGRAFVLLSFSCWSLSLSLFS